MTFAVTINRLRQAVVSRQRGEVTKQVRVDRADLEALLDDHARLDRKVRVDAADRDPTDPVAQSRLRIARLDQVRDLLDWCTGVAIAPRLGNWLRDHAGERGTQLVTAERVAIRETLQRADGDIAPELARRMLELLDA